MPPRTGKKGMAAGPSKRRRNETGQVFFNDAAESVYHQIMASKDGIRERGFNTTITDILQNIEQRKWQKFVEQPEPAVLPLVREFYANARVQLAANPDLRNVLVRGRMVPFDHETINMLFELEDFEEDEYSNLVQHGLDSESEAIIRCIAKPRATWKMSSGEIKCLMRSQLRDNSKGWHYFISARLLPSYHVSSVTKERAILNFAIQRRMTINVGKVIENSILFFTNAPQRINLGHPSLICQLCEFAGVVYSSKEELQVPLPIIDDTVMEIFWKTGRAGHGESPPKSPLQTRKSGAGPSSSTQQSGLSDSSFAELKEQLQNFMVNTNKTLRRHSKQLDYQSDVCKALVASYQTRTTPQGGSSVFFPAAPDISPYQSEQSEEDFDGESEEGEE